MGRRNAGNVNAAEERFFFVERSEGGNGFLGGIDPVIDLSSSVSGLQKSTG